MEADPIEQQAWQWSVSRRFLEDSNATNSTETEMTASESAVLRNTFMVYGTALVAVLLIFCFIRLKFPRPYTIRNWSDELKTPLAADQYGYFSWMWKLFMIADDEFLEECGMDALCYTRVLQFGYKLSMMGIFNAIWLMPLYATSPESNDTSYITENVVKVSISFVPPQSTRLIGTVIAAYLFFGFTMWQILQEFDWFIEQRHKFLAKPKARNYAIYVRNIPRELRHDSHLESFFRQVFSTDSLLEAKIRVRTPVLSKAVAQRDALVSKLSHAIAIEDVTGRTPTHRDNMLGGQAVNSIEAYATELKEINTDVAKRIEAIEEKMSSRQFMRDIKAAASSPTGSVEQAEETASTLARTRDTGLNVPAMDHDKDKMGATSLIDQWEEDKSSRTLVAGNVTKLTRSFANKTNSVVHMTASAVTSTTSVATNTAAMLLGGEEGDFYGAGFVSFTNLSTANAAMQMVHHSKPFAMEVLEAPDPDDVDWSNVGKTHKEVQLGKLFSLASSVALCFLWTIPMSFFASLSSVEALRAQFGFIDDLLNAAPFLIPVFELLAPLLVILFNALLPTILAFVTKLEGPISGAFAEASLFLKLSAFMIIQTFFVSAISGSLFQSFASIANNPAEVVDLLANTLPAQSTYFIQIVFIGTLISSSTELLRIVPLVLAAIRSCVGPRLTEEERGKSYLFLRPLADPADFEHADVFSQTILYFMVLFVYAVIAPLTCFVIAFCLLYLGAAYRHQFVYIYPTQPDSGGQLWTKFVGIVMACMIIAEITVLGLLALKKAAAAIPLMVPLLIITLLFDRYIRQEHFRVASRLTSKECIKADLGNGPGSDKSFLKGAYVQPELQVKEALPEMTTDREITLGFLESDQFLTPPHSEEHSLEGDQFPSEEETSFLSGV